MGVACCKVISYCTWVNHLGTVLIISQSKDNTKVNNYACYPTTSLTRVSGNHFRLRVCHSLSSCSTHHSEETREGTTATTRWFSAIAATTAASLRPDDHDENHLCPQKRPASLVLSSSSKEDTSHQIVPSATS
mmetsp:Transcript_8762/g.15945  ORF Transcript_8762/g.15945 Transcript_8762/m.15945 type:complete len:133 (+) Transcript_8762:106-504(+)